MSIFKETLDPEIQTQLKARTLVVSGENNNRSGLLPWYLSKNAWVRMTSFVNFTEGKIDFDGLGSVIIDPTTGHYKENQLSKKYILEGGTLYTKEIQNQTFSTPRFGVATPNAVYGGDIDARPDRSVDPDYFRQFGLRPMPGITDVRLRTIGAYGSLFETTVNFHAWDTNQLNELEILFMRPGYSVLLEWGWSQYLDYIGTDTKFSKDKLNENQIQPSVFLGQTIDPFANNLTPEIIYEKLEDLRKKYRYNYDGMLGYIKNFNWKLRKDGGYDCSTTLISMGEVINTIKLSTNANNVGTRRRSQNIAGYVYDDYEKVLLSLKARSETPQLIDNVNTLPEDKYKGEWDYDTDFIPIEDIVTTLKENGYTTDAEKLEKFQPYLIKIKNDTDDLGQGKFYEYISINTLIAIISSYSNIKSEANNGSAYPSVKILRATIDDYCLAGRDSTSVQPNICIVQNPGAFKEEFKILNIENDATYHRSGRGVSPYLLNYNNTEAGVINYYDDTIRAGRIANIYVNIQFLLNTYKDMKSSSDEAGVIMVDYFKNILNKISNALGGLNNFILSTAGKNQNTLKIIDTYYLEQGKYKEKYQFDLYGLGSICKDVSIESQIFQEQSTIVAIAAQSKANLGDVYNSTQVYLNAGLEDRLAKTKFQGEENNIIQANPNYYFYRKLENLMIYARDYVVGKDGITILPTDSSNGGDPYTLLKQALLKYDGEMNFKALIPFKLRITLEGIGGIVVGQIFTVKQNILPKNYYDKKLGFIITQIEHNLKNNQWETVLTTQICILNQEDFFDENGNPKLTKNIKREGFGEYEDLENMGIILWPILIDFLTYQLTRSLIGYVYAVGVESQASGGKPNANEILYNSLSSNTLDTYWRDNVNLFTQWYNTKTTTTEKIAPTNPGFYPLHDPQINFYNFVGNWIDIWKQQNEDLLEQRFSENYTIEQALNFIKDHNTVLDTSTTEWTIVDNTLNDMYDFITKIGQVGVTFYPNNNPYSLYKGDWVFDLLNPEKETNPLSGLTTLTTFGWNYKKLTNNITQLVKLVKSNLNNVINGYNTGKTIGGSLSLNGNFYPYSDVMYRQNDSILLKNIEPEAADPQSYNSYAGRYNKLRIFDFQGSSSAPKALVWGNVIDWEGTFTGADGRSNLQIKTTGGSGLVTSIVLNQSIGFYLKGEI